MPQLKVTAAGVHALLVAERDIAVWSGKNGDDAVSSATIRNLGKLGLLHVDQPGVSRVHGKLTPRGRRVCAALRDVSVWDSYGRITPEAVQTANRIP